MTGNTISMYRGDDKPFNLAFTYSGTNAPIDITGFSVFFTVKNSTADADPGVIQKIVTTHDSPTSGLTSFTINSANTSGLSERTYMYDIQYKDTSGLRTTVTRGNFVLINDVTQT
jgi:hypothetical protein